MIGPFVGLVTCMAGYAISTFVFSALMDSGSDSMVTIATLFSVILGFVGVISILGIFIAMPIGLYLLMTNSKTVTPPVQPKH